MKYRATLRRLKRRLPKRQPRVIRVTWVSRVDPDTLRAEKSNEQSHDSSTSASPPPLSKAPLASEELP